MTTETQRARPWARTAGLVFLQLIATAGLVEIGLRLLRPHHRGLATLLYSASVSSRFDEIDSVEELLGETVLGWSPKTVHSGFVLNSRSFRAREYTQPAPPGTQRILVLGDSFTFASGGVGFSRMWHQRLEQTLVEHGFPVEVYSLGVPGIGPQFQLRLWELEHVRVGADLVVMGFFVGNDFTDEREHHLEPWIETAPVRASYTLRLLRNLYRLAQLDSSRPDTKAAEEETDASGAARVDRQGGVELEERPPRSPRQTGTVKHYLNLESNRIRLCLDENRDELAGLAADADTVLRRLRDEVRLEGGELVVMLIPDEYQIDDALRADVLRHLGASPEEVDVERPQRELTARLAAAGIPFLDLLADFREAGQAQRLYWPRNTHWNEEGNALAGRLLAEFLEREGLLDRPAERRAPSLAAATSATD